MTPEPERVPARSATMESKKGRRPSPEVTWVLAASFTGVMGVQMVSPLLPAMRAGLHLTTGGVAWVIGAFSIAALAGTLPAGMLADRIGSRRILLPSLLLFGGAGLAVPLVKSLVLVAVLRSLQGLGYAAVVPLTITVLTGAVAHGRVAMVQSYRVATMSTAEFLLPLVAGLLLTITGSWQVIYFLYFVPLVLGALPWATGLLRPADLPRQSLDRRWLDQLGSAVRDGPIVSVIAVGFIRWWLKYSFFTYGPLYMVSRMHVQPDVIGAVIAVQGLLSAAVASQSGRLGLMRQGRVALIAATGGMGVAIAALTAVAGIWWMVGMSCLLGCFDGVVGALMNGLIAVLPPQEVRSTVVSVSGTTRNLGKAVAPGLGGILVATLGFRLGFVAIGCVGIAAPLFLFPLFRVPSPLPPASRQPWTD